MSPADVLSTAVPLLMAGSLACLLAMLLSMAARAWFGASLAYASWWIVPVILIGMALPQGDAEVVPMLANEPIRAVTASLPSLHASYKGGSFDGLLLAIWATGTVAALVFVLVRERRVAGLVRDAVQVPGHGVLRVFVSATWPFGPATLGVFRPRIILPTNVEAHYEAAELALVMQHEATHVRRHDTLWNAFGTLIVAVGWFNPVFHLALRRFRHDQEIACDDAVVRRTGARRTYANAMLKTAFPSIAGTAACGWPDTHAMQERIAMLSRPIRSSLRYRLGASLLVLCMATTSLCIYAGTAPTGSQDLTVQLTVSQKGKPAWDSVACVAQDQKIAIPYNGTANHFGALGFRVAPTPDGQWRIYDMNKGEPTRFASNGHGGTTVSDDQHTFAMVTPDGVPARAVWNEGMPSAMTVDILVHAGCESAAVAMR